MSGAKKYGVLAGHIAVEKLLADPDLAEDRCAGGAFETGAARLTGRKGFGAVAKVEMKQRVYPRACER